jgi:hypothetical protein
LTELSGSQLLRDGEERLGISVEIKEKTEWRTNITKKQCGMFFAPIGLEGRYVLFTNIFTGWTGRIFV